MKKIYTLLLLSIPFFGQAQIDVFNSGTLTFGLQSKSNNYSGFYARDANSYTPGSISAIDNPEILSDHGSAINLNANLYKFSDNGFEIYNLESILYMLSYFARLGKNQNGELSYALANLVTTPSENLSNVPNPVDFEKASRFWNFDWVNIKAFFGRKNLNGGFNLVFKNIGLTGPFTYFQEKNSNYYYYNLSESYTMRIMAGPSIAYRKTIDKFSIVAITGANFSANRSEFKIKYNPYIDVVAFFGKKQGGTLGFKYELVKGVNKPFLGALTNDASISQTEIKLGIYIR
jgi:hypothetical protein